MEENEYILENKDGTDRVTVPKWLYDHVLTLEARSREFVMVSLLPPVAGAPPAVLDAVRAINVGSN